MPEIERSSRCIGTSGAVAMMLLWSDSSCSRIGLMGKKEILINERREDERDAAEFIRKDGAPGDGSRRRLASICFENYSWLSHSYVATWMMGAYCSYSDPSASAWAAIALPERYLSDVKRCSRLSNDVRRERVLILKPRSIVAADAPEDV
jgi:hypothetical protein